MRLFLSVHGESGSVEAPEEMRMPFEEVGIGAVHEVKLSPVSGIVIPEALAASEIRQAGVDSHPSSCAYY